MILEKHSIYTHNSVSHGIYMANLPVIKNATQRNAMLIWYIVNRSNPHIGDPNATEMQRSIAMCPDATLSSSTIPYSPQIMPLPCSKPDIHLPLRPPTHAPIAFNNTLTLLPRKPRMLIPA